MTRSKIFIIGLGAALAFPAAAFAGCGTMHGSFAVTCEQGVQVYRHNSLSGVPAPLTQGEVALQIEKSRAKTASAQLAAQERASRRSDNIRERELALADYNARVNDTNLRVLRRNSNLYYGGYGRGYGFNTGGFNVANTGFNQRLRERARAANGNGNGNANANGNAATASNVASSGPSGSRLANSSGASSSNGSSAGAAKKKY